MSAVEDVDSSQFKGWRKYYNSTTHQGRLGCTVVTYAGVALISLILWLKPKKAKSIEGRK